MTPIAVRYLIVTGGGGVAMTLLWALDRRVALDPETAALAITAAGALAGGYLGGCLDRRASALESLIAALGAVATIALLHVAGHTSPLLAPITISGGWLAPITISGVAVALVAALAGARLGVRRPRQSRAAIAALLFAGTFVALLAAFLVARAFSDSVLIIAGTFALMFWSPFLTGMLLVLSFGDRAYAAVRGGVTWLVVLAAGVVAIAELGAGRLHSGEIAAIAALIACAGGVFGRVSVAGVDAAIGKGWGPPRTPPGELPRAAIRRAPPRE